VLHLGAKSFDVAVIGGGPSGLALSTVLRQRTTLSVAVIEKTRYEAPRVGETLSPGTQRLLQYLGVWEHFHDDGHLPSYGTSACWGTADLVSRDFICTPHGNGWHLDRRRFDETLAGYAEDVGVDLLRGTVARSIPNACGGWNLALKNNRGVSEMGVRFLVDATGIASSIARQAGARRQILDRMVGVRATVRFDHEPLNDSYTLVESFEYGWWYSAKLPGSQAIVVLMTDPDLVRDHDWADSDRFWSVLQNCRNTWHRLRKGELSSAPRVVPAFSARLNRVYGRDWLAIGDAAASVDPLSSSGIPRALDSGIRGARAIDLLVRFGRSDAMATFDRYIQSTFDDYLVQQQQYYAMETRWPDSLFWKRHSSSCHLPRDHKELPPPNSDSAEKAVAL